MVLFWKKSIAGQLSFVITLTMICAFFVVGIIVYNYMAEVTKEYIKNENILRAESISKDISYSFEETRVIVQQMATNQQIIKFLKTVESRDNVKKNSEYPDVLKTLQGVRSSNGLFNIAWVGNEKASFYIDDSGLVSGPDYIITQRPWFNGAKNSKGIVFSAPYVDYGTKKIIISCILSIREGNQVIGFAAVDLVIENIPEFFKQYKIGQTGVNFLLAGDGTYLYHDDQSKIMVENILKSSGGLQSVGSTLLSAQKKNGFAEIKYQGDDYFLAYYPTRDNDWIVCSLISKKEAMQGLKLIAALVAGLCALAVVVIVMLVFTLFQHVTSPLRAISDYAGEIAEGDFSKKLPEDFLIREDEMGELARSFQIITDAFRNENEILGQKVHEAEVSLEKQYSYILEAEKMASLGTLVAGVAHEINTPLGVGLSLASYLEEINQQNRQRLQKGEMSKADLQKFMADLDNSLQLMGSNLTRAAEMVKSFKQVAVDQSSEIKTDFSLAETLNAVVLSLRHEYKRIQCQFHLDCPENLRLKSYPGAFIQIFSNLIINSIKHGFADKSQGNIYIQVLPMGDMLRIIYKDDGVGIPAENIRRIYDPFFTTARQRGSSGLGLNIVYNLITQQLRGNIECHSQVGHGVEFVIKVAVEGGAEDE